MPFNLGPGELIFLAAAALLLFGPQKLPEIGRTLGEALGSLKKAYNSAANLEDLHSSSTQVANQTNYAQSHTAPASIPLTSELANSAKPTELNSEPDIKACSNNNKQ